jgi:uncharacterized protein YbjT (DUF2867 family)
MSDIRFLVTGATGATGSAAATQLLDKGRRVRAFVHREDERSESLRRRGAEVVIGDLLDFDVVREALKGVNRASAEGRRVMTGVALSEADRITGRPAKEFLVQHLRGGRHRPYQRNIRSNQRIR